MRKVLSLGPLVLLHGCGARTGLEELEAQDAAGGSGIGGSWSPGTFTGGATFVNTAAGGRAFGGTSTGGATFVNTVTGGRTFINTATGGRTFGGTSTGGRPFVNTVTGGRPFGGTSTGGRTFGGTSTGGRTFGGTSTGGRTFGGTSTGGTTSLCPASMYVESRCIQEVIEAQQGLCNDLDDDCDGTVDEGCPCTPGTVKKCFAGPPGRRGVGACSDGLQACEATPDLVGRFGPCLGGITPSTEICDTLDNDCDGCRDEIPGCVPVGSCPGPGDPRIAEIQPFSSHSLNAADYFDGDARSIAWSVEGGPCDKIAPTAVKSFDLLNPSSKTATFKPRLSGDYTITLVVTALSGESFRCDWVLPVRGPGLRVEMCYPESDRCDLDLYLKQLSTPTPWFSAGTSGNPSSDTCGWHNCEARLRGDEMSPAQAISRADWGYPRSPLSECEGGPTGADWAALGYCANPRLDIDNNQQQGTGLPENINIDQPRSGDGFRIMVRNFSGDEAHPIVNVYCGGTRVATFGAPPDTLPAFSGTARRRAIGPMWRVADVVTDLDAKGATTCTVTGLHPVGSDSGYFVTWDDPSF